MIRFERAELFVNGNYSVYFDLGLVFSGFDKPRAAKTIVVFGEEKNTFWKNKHRPLY